MIKMATTMKIETMKLEPSFYCMHLDKCSKGYLCINPMNLLNSVCKHLLMQASLRKSIEGG